MARLLDTWTPLARWFSKPLRLALFLALMAGAMPALADNTFLLQLESSETRELAVQKWEEIKFKNKDVLGTLPMHVAEVALPPDNKTTYRTQVGPLPSRADAEGLCNTLQNRGVDCYVVETAMFASEQAPESIADVPLQSSPQAKEETPEPEEVPASARKPSKPSIEESEAEPVAAPASAPAPTRKPAKPSAEELAHADDPDYIPPPVDSGPVVISSWTGSAPTESASTNAQQPVEVARASTREAPAENITENSTPAVTTIAPEPAPAPAPEEKQAEKPGFFARLFGSSPEPQPANASSVVGSVDVGEAVRVPLTTTQPPRTRIVPVIPTALHPLGGYPGDSTARTFWAQISYFRDEAQALKFYRLWAAAYPQFSNGVRIRITRPFMSELSANRVSLRVGPFAGTGDVQAICATADRWRARCIVVRDIGASTAMGSAPTRRRTAGEKASQGPAYWVQLGTYKSEEEAQAAWKTLRKLHHSATRHLHSNVTQPPASSAETPLFRLRAGPFRTEDRANTACNRLASSATGCVVVTGY